MAAAMHLGDARSYWMAAEAAKKSRESSKEEMQGADRSCKTEARLRGASGRRLQQKQQEEAAVIANNALPVGAAGPRPCISCRAASSSSGTA